MTNLKEEQIEFFKQYDHLLHTMSEGLEYLEDNVVEQTDLVHQVFDDLLKAFQQIGEGHDQMLNILEEKQEYLQNLVKSFHEIVELLSNWFDKPTSEEKQSLLKENVIPYFESWKNDMQLLLKPYITH